MHGSKESYAQKCMTIFADGHNSRNIFKVVFKGLLGHLLIFPYQPVKFVLDNFANIISLPFVFNSRKGHIPDKKKYKSTFIFFMRNSYMIFLKI